MTPTDAIVTLGLIAGVLGILALVLALVALVNRAITRAWTAGTNAAARHIETCITQALQQPLYGLHIDNGELEEEHRRLIAGER